MDTACDRSGRGQFVEGEIGPGGCSAHGISTLLLQLFDSRSTFCLCLFDGGSALGFGVVDRRGALLFCLFDGRSNLLPAGFGFVFPLGESGPRGRRLDNRTGRIQRRLGRRKRVSQHLVQLTAEHEQRGSSRLRRHAHVLREGIAELGPFRLVHFGFGSVATAVALRTLLLQFLDALADLGRESLRVCAALFRNLTSRNDGKLRGLLSALKKFNASYVGTGGLVRDSAHEALARILNDIGGLGQHVVELGVAFVSRNSLRVLNQVRGVKNLLRAQLQVALRSLELLGHTLLHSERHLPGDVAGELRDALFRDLRAGGTLIRRRLVHGVGCFCLCGVGCGRTVNGVSGVSFLVDFGFFVGGKSLVHDAVNEVGESDC
mmetsp:Transcript_50978/g.75641  ORF Transcript_50978/g.75641 Transcript_50978/m.75641 type:complete len:376 (-) Transcript_50978:812-1939(-)